MNNPTILIYYTFALIVIILTGYVVFILNHLGWWFLLDLIILEMSPTLKKK